MADLTKLNGYAVVNPASDAAASALKINAYAVTNPADAYQSLGKLVAYAAIVESTGVVRPQVFVCT